MKIKLSTLAALSTLSACGQKQAANDEARRLAEAQAAAAKAPLVVGAAGDAVLKTAGPGTCSADLRRETIIDPKERTETTVFTGLVANDCTSDGKRAVLYIDTDSVLKIDGDYACKNAAGEYNIRCDGPSVKYGTDGSVRIAIGAGSGSDPNPVRMRFTFEK